MASARKYARDTDVPVTKTKTEIEQVLIRFGCSRFGTMIEERRAAIVFEHHDLRYRMILPLTVIGDHMKREDGAFLSTNLRQPSMDAEHRRRWRSLYLVLKAILVGVDDGILTMEEALLSFLVLPTGETIGEQVIPNIRRTAQTGELPPMVAGLPTGKVIALGSRTGT